MLLSKQRILIVPDFGNTEAAKRLLPLKEAIQEHSSLDAKIIDLRQMTIDENPDKKLKEVQILDLAAPRLEALAADNTIVWEKPNLSEQLGDAPHAIVVFGKSVMLAGGVSNIPVLFVDPEYDKEWPWRKRYYVDRKETDSFYDSFLEKINATRQPKVSSRGYEAEYRRQQPQRFCLLTEGNDEDEFSERYPRLAMSDPELQDPRQLAKAITEFTGRKLEMPMLDIYELMKVPARSNMSRPFAFHFQLPVDVDGQKASEILLEGFSPYRMPGEVVILKECAYNRSLESVHDRKSLLRLREAMAEAQTVVRYDF